MIELGEGDFVRCFWRATAPGIDFLGTLYRAKGEWALVYRFRYDSRSGDPWDDSDVKNWYRSDLGPAEIGDARLEEAVKAGDIAFRVGMRNFRRVDVNGGPPEFMAAMQKEDGASIRETELKK